MVSGYIQDIALSLGLCPEKGLPMANEENKQLLLLIDNLGDEKNQLQTSLQNFNERAERLVTHAKNSEVTHAQNMKLIYAYQTDLRTEQSLRKLSDRQNSKLKHDLKDLQQERETVCHYEENAENDIKRRNKTISDLSNRINWIKAALVEWRQCMEQGNAANQLIEKYCKNDQKKYLEIDTKRRILQDSIIRDRRTLIDLVEEQKSLEQNLDRTANLYRAAHLERRDMVNTWKTAVHHMNQREQDILNTEAELERMQKKCMEKEAELKAEEKRLDDMIASNREVEANIQVLNDEISVLREHLQSLIDLVALRENEVDILRKELQGLANRVQMQRQHNRQETKHKADKERELARCIETNKKLKISHETLRTKNMNAQERLRLLEEMIDSEERAKAKLSLETNQMNDLLFRTQQHLQKFKDEEKIQEVENGGIRLNITAVGRNLKDTQKLFTKETENHYDISLKVVLLERRINKIKGNVVDPAEERLKLVELSKMEAYYDEASKVLVALQLQTTKLEADMRKLTICYNNDMKEIDSMNFKIKEAHLYCEGGVKKIRLTTRSNQEKIVELSILKMRVNEMENQISQCQDRSYNLDKHRLQLVKTIKERMVEINSQYDLMYLKRKHLLEELSILKCDIGDRNIKIQAAKARYELTTKLLGNNEDGSPVTATQMKVENAQEKQMLLEEGNTLNANVLKAEQEIKAMEHTLALMNCSNEIYRRNFEELDEDAEDIQELKDLQAEYCKYLAQLKTLRNKAIQLERKVDNLIQEKQELEDNMEELQTKKVENNEILKKVHKELLDQSVKIERASREVKTAWKTTRQRSFDSLFLATFSKDLDMQELEKRNTTGLQLFADLIDSDGSVAPQATKMLYAKGIECPKARKSSKALASWRGDYLDLSLSSSKDLLSSRSSGSMNSVTKLTASTRPSVVSIDFPTQTFCFKK